MGGKTALSSLLHIVPVCGLNITPLYSALPKVVRFVNQHMPAVTLPKPYPTSVPSYEPWTAIMLNLCPNKLLRITPFPSYFDNTSSASRLHPMTGVSNRGADIKPTTLIDREVDQISLSLIIYFIWHRGRSASYYQSVNLSSRLLYLSQIKPTATHPDHELSSLLCHLS